MNNINNINYNYRTIEFHEIIGENVYGEQKIKIDKNIKRFNKMMIISIVKAIIEIILLILFMAAIILYPPIAKYRLIIIVTIIGVYIIIRSIKNILQKSPVDDAILLAVVGTIAIPIFVIYMFKNTLEQIKYINNSNYRVRSGTIEKIEESTKGQIIDVALNDYTRILSIETSGYRRLLKNKRFKEKDEVVVIVTNCGMVLPLS